MRARLAWLLVGGLTACHSDVILVVRSDEVAPVEAGALVDGQRTATEPLGDAIDEPHVGPKDLAGILAMENFEAPLTDGNAIVFGYDLTPELVPAPWTPAYETLKVTPRPPIELRLTVVLMDLPGFGCETPDDPQCFCDRADPLLLQVPAADQLKAGYLCNQMRTQVDALAALLETERVGLKLGPLEVVDARAVAPSTAAGRFRCEPALVGPYLEMLDKAAAGWDACPQDPPRLTVIATMRGLQHGNDIVTGLHCPGFGPGVPEPFGPAACQIDPAIWPRQRRLIGVDVQGGAFVLAHEVGHALGLEHLTAGQEALAGMGGNLMRRFVPASAADVTEAQSFRAHYHPRSAVRRDLGARPLSEAIACPTATHDTPRCPPIERSLWSTGYAP